MMDKREDLEARRRKAWKRRQRQETINVIGIILLAIVAVCAGIFFIAGIFSAIGFIPMLVIGHVHTFWNGAMAGFGTMVLGGLFTFGLTVLIRAIRG